MQDNNYSTPNSERLIGSPELISYVKIKSIQDSIIKMRKDYLTNYKNNIPNFFLNPMFQNLNLINTDSFLPKRKMPKTEQDLVNLEAKLGGSLFKKTYPEEDVLFFFNRGSLIGGIGNNDSWIININNKGSRGERTNETTRFIPSESGGTKVIDAGRRFVPMTEEESENLCAAANLYNRLARENIYFRDSFINNK